MTASERAADAATIASAREGELRALFVELHRGVAGLDPNAEANFRKGICRLDTAFALALAIVANADPRV